MSELSQAIAAMHAAYVAESGLPVTLNYGRTWALTQLHERGFTADDVRAVIAALKKKIARGDRGFTESSISFGNALADPDKFEERALLLRQQAARRKGAAPRVQTARTDAAGVTRLDEAPPSAPTPIDEATAAWWEKTAAQREAAKQRLREKP